MPAYLRIGLKGKGLPREPWRAAWLGIRRFNLKTGEDTRILDRESFRIPPPYTSGWVSQILSVSADGSGVIGVVGLLRGSTMTYFVYELSVVVHGLK